MGETVKGLWQKIKIINRGMTHKGKVSLGMTQYLHKAKCHKNLAQVKAHSENLEVRKVTRESRWGKLINNKIRRRKC